MTDWLNAYDKDADTKRTELNLPHWFQAHTATFLTLRLADSMPANVLERWKREQLDFLARAGIVGVTVEEGEAKLQEPWRTTFMNYRWRRFQIYLQHSYGKCELQLPSVAAVIRDVLLDGHEQSYFIDRFVVMPNHIHLLAAFGTSVDMLDVCKAWMRDSAKRISSIVEIDSNFWQEEPFDHCIRSGEQLEQIRRYIANNPSKARIARSRYLYWEHGK